MPRWLRRVEAALMACAFVASLDLHTLARPARDVTPYRTLRFSEVIGQTSWFTCGPAALATLLSVYYDMEATERSVLEIALGEDGAAAEEAGEGISLLSLKRALGGFGVESRALRTTGASLRAYFDAGGLPIIAHFNRPRRHYVVLVGALSSGVLVADPSFGIRVASLEQLRAEKGFEGVVLVPVPPGERATVAASRQKRALDGYENRAARLANLGRRMP